MPLSIYTFMFLAAKLSETDVDAIFRRTQEERAWLIMENMARKSQK